MEKVKLTKRQAETLKVQISKAAEYLCNDDKKVVSEFLIRMRLAPDSKDYAFWFGGEFKEIEFPCSFVTYVDALRVGYEVELSLEEELLEMLDEEYQFAVRESKCDLERTTKSYWKGKAVAFDTAKKMVKKYLNKEGHEEKQNG